MRSRHQACYLCGAFFGPSEIAQHRMKCYQEAVYEWDLADPRTRGPKPLHPRNVGVDRRSRSRSRSAGRLHPCDYPPPRPCVRVYEPCCDFEDPVAYAPGDYGNYVGRPIVCSHGRPGQLVFGADHCLHPDEYSWQAARACEEGWGYYGAEWGPGGPDWDDWVDGPEEEHRRSGGGRPRMGPRDERLSRPPDYPPFRKTNRWYKDYLHDLRAERDRGPAPDPEPEDLNPATMACYESQACHGAPRAGDYDLLSAGSARTPKVNPTWAVNGDAELRPSTTQPTEVRECSDNCIIA